jgi:hypothetical protein
MAMNELHTEENDVRMRRGSYNTGRRKHEKRISNLEIKCK